MSLSAAFAMFFMLTAAGGEPVPGHVDGDLLRVDPSVLKVEQSVTRW
jgi:hypothetical protein